MVRENEVELRREVLDPIVNLDFLFVELPIALAEWAVGLRGLSLASVRSAFEEVHH
jgi:hypothetical protein